MTKFTKHAWGVFEHRFNHRMGEMSQSRLSSTHKTEMVAKARVAQLGSYRDGHHTCRRLTKEERK